MEKENKDAKNHEKQNQQKFSKQYFKKQDNYDKKSEAISVSDTVFDQIPLCPGKQICFISQKSCDNLWLMCM